MVFPRYQEPQVLQGILKGVSEKVQPPPPVLLIKHVPIGKRKHIREVIDDAHFEFRSCLSRFAWLQCLNKGDLTHGASYPRRKGGPTDGHRAVRSSAYIVH